MMMVMMKSSVPPVMRLAQTPLILSRVPTQASSFWNKPQPAVPQVLVLNTKGQHSIVTLEFYDICLSLVFPLQPNQWT